MARQRGALARAIPAPVVHWLLAASFAGAFASAEMPAWRNAHMLLGAAAGALFAFRLVRGLIAARGARRARHDAGHDTAGSRAFLAMLALIAAIAASGWAVSAGFGPPWLYDLHDGLSDFALGLILLHIAMVVFSSVLQRDSLRRALLTGCRRARF